jgi:hypothetical protein
MARRQALAPCAACSLLCPSGKLSRVVIEGRTVLLCREHASVVAANMPRSYEELRALFREPATDAGPLARRSRIERRGRDDRRMFPPRPEGRRQTGGRRSTDKAA